MKIKFNLNNTDIYLDVNPNERLVDVLRRDFHLLSIKKGCMHGFCGGCVVLINDKPFPSCMVPIFTIQNSSIITLEHFEKTHEYQDIINIFAHAGVYLCGICNPGKIFVTYYLVKNVRNYSEYDIKEAYAGISCRCTNIDDIIVAFKRLSKTKWKR